VLLASLARCTMPAMKRRCAWHPLQGITNFFCALSLLVFVTSVTIWVRSYFVRDLVVWSWREVPTRDVGWELESTRGRCGVIRHWIDYDSPKSPMPSNLKYFKFEPKDLVGFVNTKSFKSLGVASHSAQGLAIPLWLFLPAGIPPFLWWRKWRRGRGGRGFPVQSPSAPSPAGPSAPATAKIV